jgi:hypothetical protein
MNANEISPKTNARLNRIKKVSYLFRIICLTASALGLIWTLTAIYSCLMNPTLEGFLYFGFKFTCTMGSWNAYKLFYQYSCGYLFDPKSIRSIRWIGYSCILLGLQTPLSSAVAHFGLRDPFFAIFAGSMIVFIAWIMDEGRKIHEEQELTV